MIDNPVRNQCQGENLAGGESIPHCGNATAAKEENLHGRGEDTLK